MNGLILRGAFPIWLAQAGPAGSSSKGAVEWQKILSSNQTLQRSIFTLTNSKVSLPATSKFKPRTSNNLEVPPDLGIY